MDDLVYVKKYRGGAKWLSGEVSSKVGSAMFEVKLIDGRIVLVTLTSCMYC